MSNGKCPMPNEKCRGRSVEADSTAGAARTLVSITLSAKVTAPHPTGRLRHAKSCAFLG